MRIKNPSFKKINIFSQKKGFIQNINIDRIRLLGGELGILRKKEDYPIDQGSGFLIYKRTGNCVEKNDVLGEIQFNTPTDRSFIKKEFREAFIISPNPPEFCPFIIERSSAKAELYFF